MVATPDGRLSKYFSGIEYVPRDLRLAVVEASNHKIGSAAICSCSTAAVTIHRRDSTRSLSCVCWAWPVRHNPHYLGILYLLTRKPKGRNFRHLRQPLRKLHPPDRTFYTSAIADVLLASFFLNHPGS